MTRPAKEVVDEWNVRPAHGWGPIDLMSSCEQVEATLSAAGVSFESDTDGDGGRWLLSEDSTVILQFEASSPFGLRQITIQQPTLRVSGDLVIGEPFDRVLAAFDVWQRSDLSWSDGWWQDDGPTEGRVWAQAAVAELTAGVAVAAPEQVDSSAGILWLRSLGVGLQMLDDRVFGVIVRRPDDVPRAAGALPECIASVFAGVEELRSRAERARSAATFEVEVKTFTGRVLGWCCAIGFAVAGWLLYLAEFGIDGGPPQPRLLRAAAVVAAIGAGALVLWRTTRKYVVLDSRARRIDVRREFLGAAWMSRVGGAADLHCLTVTGRVRSDPESTPAVWWEYRPMAVDSRGRRLPLGDWKKNDEGWREAHSLIELYADAIGVRRLRCPAHHILRVERTPSAVSVSHTGPPPVTAWASTLSLVTMITFVVIGCGLLLYVGFMIACIAGLIDCRYWFPPVAP